MKAKRRRFFAYKSELRSLITVLAEAWPNSALEPLGPDDQKNASDDRRSFPTLFAYFRNAGETGYAVLPNFDRQQGWRSPGIGCVKNTARAMALARQVAAA